MNLKVGYWINKLDTDHFHNFAVAVLSFFIPLQTILYSLYTINFKNRIPDG